MSPASSSSPPQGAHTGFTTLCGRIFPDADSRFFPKAMHHGHCIFFCTEACLGAYLSDPAAFYKAHRPQPQALHPIPPSGRTEPQP